MHTRTSDGSLLFFQELRFHPQRGAVFESWVASEVRKARVHGGLSPDLYHLRQTRGLEADLVVGRGPDAAVLVDAKSGTTIASDWFTPLAALARELAATRPEAPKPTCRIVYGGDRPQERNAVEVIPWRAIQQGGWA